MGDDTERMKDEIREGFKSLGVDIKFDPDADLGAFRRGRRVLKCRELQVGLIVWGFYQEHGERRPRANHAHRLLEGHGGSWILDDGSSFSMDFEPTDPEDDCHDDCGEGVMYIYEAVPK